MSSRDVSEAPVSLVLPRVLRSRWPWASSDSLPVAGALHRGLAVGCLVASRCRVNTGSHSQVGNCSVSRVYLLLWPPRGRVPEAPSSLRTCRSLTRAPGQPEAHLFPSRQEKLSQTPGTHTTRPPRVRAPEAVVHVQGGNSRSTPAPQEEAAPRAPEPPGGAPRSGPERSSRARLPPSSHSPVRPRRAAAFG